MASTSNRCLNVNVGVLGHVDSGKTSLVSALSTVLSTAALDKHPQSKERGITLDLGFSAFTVPFPSHASDMRFDTLQFTLVDCPGHASLIRTIIGGAHIMDVMMLVIDITKGIQVQTAECLVVGEITTPQLLVVLNKVDLLPAEERDKAIRKAKRNLAKTFKLTKFGDCKMIPAAAKPGDGGMAIGIQEIVEELASMVHAPPPRRDGPFLFAIDHCFVVKGHGTVLTGTALQGHIKVNDIVEIPNLGERRKVKSIQKFKQSVKEISAGDRAGVCVPGLDANKIERGLAASPGTVPTFQGAIAWVDKVRFYAGEVASKSRFHVTIGHATVMATLTFFGGLDDNGQSQQEHVHSMLLRLGRISAKQPAPPFNFNEGYQYQDQLSGLEGRKHRNENQPVHYGNQFALLNFDSPVTAPPDAVLIGARLDADIQTSSCRLAFYGQLLTTVDTSNTQDMGKLRVFKWKEKEGVIERVQPDGYTGICKGMFKKETDISAFAGLQVTLVATGDEGVIEGAFGGAGKFKVHFNNGINKKWVDDKRVKLVFKRFMFGTDKRSLCQ